MLYITAENLRWMEALLPLEILLGIYMLSITSLVLNHLELIDVQTDTASVLWEAMEYIRFLHEQVKVGSFLEFMLPEAVKVDI